MQYQNLNPIQKVLVESVYSHKTLFQYRSMSIPLNINSTLKPEKELPKEAPRRKRLVSIKKALVPVKRIKRSRNIGKKQSNFLKKETNMKGEV